MKTLENELDNSSTNRLKYLLTTNLVKNNQYAIDLINEELKWRYKK